MHQTAGLQGARPEGMPMADREYLSPPSSLWDPGSKRATHRRWQARGLTQAEEEYAVHEALRAAHVKVWRDLWARVHTAEARVVELQAENRRLRRKKR